MKMTAADLDRQITIEKKTVTRDPTYNTEVVGWAPLIAAPNSRIWASVIDVPASRSEILVPGGVLVTKNQTKVTIRYRPDVNSAMRITVHGETNDVYQIVSGPTEVYGRKQFLEMMCEAYST